MLSAQQRLAGLSPGQAQRTSAAAVALGRGQLEAAMQALAAVLPQAAQHPEVLRIYGLIQQQRGRHGEAIQALQRAAALRPDDAMIHNALAGVYEALNDAARAREALRRACEVGPDVAPCWFNYGWRLFVDGDVDAAIPVLQRAVQLNPADAQARTLLADVLRADGKPEQAEALLRRIIAETPPAAQAWWTLATFRPVPLGGDDIDAMRGLLAGAALTESDRVTIEAALAMALEARGDFAGAFAAMQSAHALARNSEPYDAGVFTRRVDAILAAFDSPLPAAATAQGEAVVFIVSLPRSGSTLTEQILASHSQVGAGAELPDLPHVIRRASDRAGTAFPHWVADYPQAQWQALGHEYLQRTARWRNDRPRFTDKMPANWLYVGAILSMLPDARVVICRRDPLETCLGCYRYMFRRHPYTHVFADLAQRWRDFDRAARHWKSLYPQRVREQVYEDLVADPETQIRELLGFCGLPFEHACLDFHTTQRRVTTPSAAQVREPIRRDSARAERYGALLDPLRSALGMPGFSSR